MKKYSLINIEQKYNFKFQEGDVIDFEMPPFCSGEYEAIVCKDPKYGPYIDSEDNHFNGCRDWEVYRNGSKVQGGG